MIFYIDPMSYNNLEIYDLNLLKNIKEEKILFFGNEKISKIPDDFIAIYSYSNKKGIKKILSYLYSQMKLFIFVLKFKPRVIHFQWFKLPYFDFIFISFFKKIKIKVVFTAHNKLPHDTGNKYKIIYKAIYKKVDKIIVHSNITKNEMIKEFLIMSNKIEVIPHGLLNFGVKDDIIIDKNHKNVKIGFLGHLSEYKGIDYLIELLEILDDKSNIEFIIAGKGNLPKINYSKVTINNKFLSDMEFINYLKMVDILLLPYKEISQSGVLLSGLALKKLVIVTNVGGLVEPFDVGDVGWIISKDNVVEELHKLMKEISENVSLVYQKRMKNETWEAIDEYYSWERIGKITVSLYKKLGEI